MSKANTSLFLALKGLETDMTEDSFKTEVLKYLHEEHRSKLIGFKKQKQGLAVLYFDKWETAKSIASTYKHKLLECSPSITLFSNENPESQS